MGRNAVRRVPSADIGSLVSSKVELDQQAWFFGPAGRTRRLEIRDLPHFHFCAQVRRGRLAEARSDLAKFLACTEGEVGRCNEHIDRFLALQQDIEKNGIREPLSIVQAPDGRRIVLDGHKRASIAYVLDQDAPYRLLELKPALAELALNSQDRYGTGSTDRPYQSIFYKEKELIPGRRTDILRRFRKLRPTDVRGCSVLDVGSNIAVNAMMAWHAGAESVLAMEFSPRIATTALRLAAVLDAGIRVEVQDLGKPIEFVQPFDTVFCFSLHDHVGDKSALADNLARATGRTLYFEGHENSSRSDYEHVFAQFSTIEALGFNSDGMHSKAATRPFFRCAKA